MSSEILEPYNQIPADQLKIPISGGPCTGKTTLLNELPGQHPDAYFVKEPATLVITEQLERQAQDKNYDGIFPLNNYPEFLPLVIAKSLELEKEIPDTARLAFQDRSLVDNIGYGKMLKFEDYFPRIEKCIKMARYAMAFVCEPLEIYEQTEVRRETREEALKTHEFLSAAYEESGLRVVHLPPVSVPERLEIIRSTIADLQSRPEVA